MTEALELWEQPQAQRIHMILGWRQWADAGAISSGLPRYLIERTQAHQIGIIRPDDFYLFQIPGTHDLVRPIVRFEEGFPEALEVAQNEIYYAGDSQHGLVIFLGDEPQINMERYVATVLQAGRALKVERMIGLGGVYGEFPYDKSRLISCIYSQREMQGEIAELAVNLSNYHGGASVGSYICKRASEESIEYVGFYSFVPIYDFSRMSQVGKTLRIEEDYTAWLGTMRRIKHMTRYRFDLSNLEAKSRQLTRDLEAKIDELEREYPQLGVRSYMQQLSRAFTEIPFDPLDDVWEEEIRRLFDESEADEE